MSCVNQYRTSFSVDGCGDDCCAARPAIPKRPTSQVLSYVHFSSVPHYSGIVPVLFVEECLQRKHVRVSALAQILCKGLWCLTRSIIQPIYFRVIFWAIIDRLLYKWFLWRSRCVFFILHLLGLLSHIAFVFWIVCSLSGNLGKAFMDSVTTTLVQASVYFCFCAL